MSQVSISLFFSPACTEDARIPGVDRGMSHSKLTTSFQLLVLFFVANSNPYVPDYVCLSTSNAVMVDVVPRYAMYVRAMTCSG